MTGGNKDGVESDCIALLLKGWVGVSLLVVVKKIKKSKIVIKDD